MPQESLVKSNRTMDIKDKVVTRLPLQELWTTSKTLEHRRKRKLKKDDIKGIIKTNPVEFVFADVGHKLHWTNKGECFEIWKREIEKHLIENNEKINLEDFPDNYGYLASEWTDDQALPIVLLEKLH
jgi:hypothetical protein